MPATIVQDGGSPGAIASPATREISMSQLASMPTPGRSGAPAVRPAAQPAKAASEAPPPAPKREDPAPKTHEKPAKQDLKDGLRKLAGMEPEQNAPLEKPSTETDPETKPTEGQPVTDGKKPKPNPWKLYEAEKAARAKVEQEFQEHRKNILPENDRKSYEERVTKAEARAKELEDHIRFVDYSKSEEFTTQYAKPLESAWASAVEELSELRITDPSTNQPRPVTAQDIYELVHLPLDKAREIAKEVFGEFADDVMFHRKEIKGLLKKQQEALDNAKKTGEERAKTQAEQTKTQQAALTKEVSARFNEYVGEITADKVNGEFFTPRKPAEEGVELTPEEAEHNAALEGAWKRINQWKNPVEPGITSEERASRLKLDIAMRHMAAAYPGMKKQIFRMRKAMAELQKKIDSYQGSTPGAGGSHPSGNGNQPLSAREEMRQRLAKLAK